MFLEEKDRRGFFCSYLKWLFTGVNELMTLELGRLNESLAALVANVNARSVCVQVFAHGRIITEQLHAALVRTHDTTARAA